jgi:hypothetical protein
VLQAGLAPIGRQRLALLLEPALVAGGVVGHHPHEQLASVTAYGSTPIARPDRFAEGLDIGGNGPADALPLRFEPGSPTLPPAVVEELAQVVARGLFILVGPEQGQQFVALDPVLAVGEIGAEQQRLLDRDRLPPAVECPFCTAEQLQLHRHGRPPLWNR